MPFAERLSIGLRKAAGRRSGVERQLEGCRPWVERVERGRRGTRFGEDMDRSLVFAVDGMELGGKLAAVTKLSVCSKSVLGEGLGCAPADRNALPRSS